ncbi:hypothetical protein B0H16DRAFT_1460967 [Mycena metata]|uniref:Uncharacterized protein n=1 Tax=Mycena metata TaxID=1033252 RepID=A0AAD7IT95_9AGAR|nr:hypothetical protein B0H16DRAFT_1460967 [Mycena metata]
MAMFLKFREPPGGGGPALVVLPRVLGRDTEEIGLVIYWTESISSLPCPIQLSVGRSRGKYTPRSLRIRYGPGGPTRTADEYVRLQRDLQHAEEFETAFLKPGVSAGT